MIFVDKRIKDTIIRIYLLLDVYMFLLLGVIQFICFLGNATPMGESKRQELGKQINILKCMDEKVLFKSKKILRCKK